MIKESPTMRSGGLAAAKKMNLIEFTVPSIHPQPIPILFVNQATILENHCSYFVIISQY
jgi:hypothetical protein